MCNTVHVNSHFRLVEFLGLNDGLTDYPEYNLHELSSLLWWGASWFGVVMLNFSFIIAIPAWLWRRHPTVDVPTIGFGSSLLSICLYILICVYWLSLTFPIICLNPCFLVSLGQLCRSVQACSFMIVGLGILSFSVLTRMKLMEILCLTVPNAQWRGKTSDTHRSRFSSIQIYNERENCHWPWDYFRCLSFLLQSYWWLLDSQLIPIQGWSYAFVYWQVNQHMVGWRDIGHLQMILQDPQIPEEEKSRHWKFVNNDGDKGAIIYPAIPSLQIGRSIPRELWHRQQLVPDPFAVISVSYKPQL